MLGDCDLMAFVATADLGAARAFYLNTLGLRLVDESDFALVFDAHGTPLRVVPVSEPVIAPYTVLGWRVDNLEQTLRHLAESGCRRAALRVWHRTRLESGRLLAVTASRGSATPMATLFQ